VSLCAAAVVVVGLFYLVISFVVALVLFVGFVLCAFLQGTGCLL